ncbi:MAG TPA: glycosyltransferase [Acidimicrobiia bacterium]|nr:glycosyltransferase [Acidimicrobiia bacterium]
MADVDVRVHVASINTRSSTELCIRSMRESAGHPFDLVVGDGNSTDGSLAMLERFQQRGWLKLERADGPRMHGDWLDGWLKDCPTRYCVFCDSDMEFLAGGWLRDMVDEMTSTGAALVCAYFTPPNPDYVHPVFQNRMQLGPRPSPWLLLLDLDQVRDISSSFLFHEELSADGSPTIAYDVGGYFFHELVERGLPWRAMPESFLAKVHHFGGMSWGLPGGGGNRAFLTGDQKMTWVQTQRVRAQQIKKRARIRWHLERVRRAKGAAIR